MKLKANNAKALPTAIPGESVLIGHSRGFNEGGHDLAQFGPR